MDKDIIGNFNNINLQKYGATKANIASAQSSCVNIPESVQLEQESMDCLDAMGKAQVNMSKIKVSDSVKRSTEGYLANPEYVQAHVDFCDSLVQEGINLEDAIDKTDKAFRILKDKDTYQ